MTLLYNQAERGAIGNGEMEENGRAANTLTKQREGIGKGGRRWSCISFMILYSHYMGISRTIAQSISFIPLPSSQTPSRMVKEQLLAAKSSVCSQLFGSTYYLIE